MFIESMPVSRDIFRFPPWKEHKFCMPELPPERLEPPHARRWEKLMKCQERESEHKLKTARLTMQLFH